MIQVGESIPEATFKIMGDNGPQKLTSAEIFGGKRVVMFGVPGAFTPGCTRTHLPGYVEHAEEILAQGFDEIVCVAVNDAWVMDAWGNSVGAQGKVKMLADGSADFARAAGLELDLNHVGMGMRCKRFSMVVQNGIVESLNIDERMIESTSAIHTCGLSLSLIHI